MGASIFTGQCIKAYIRSKHSSDDVDDVVKKFSLTKDQIIIRWLAGKCTTSLTMEKNGSTHNNGKHISHNKGQLASTVRIGCSMGEKLHYFDDTINSPCACSIGGFVESRRDDEVEPATYLMTVGHSENAKGGKFYDDPQQQNEVGCLKMALLGDVKDVFTDVALVEINKGSGMMFSRIQVADKYKHTRRIKLEVQTRTEIEDKYMMKRGSVTKQICKHSSDGVVYGQLFIGTINVDGEEHTAHLFSANEPYKNQVSLPGQSGCPVTGEPRSREDKDFINLIAIMCGRNTIPSSASDSSVADEIEEFGFMTLLSSEVIERLESYLQPEQFNRIKPEVSESESVASGSESVAATAANQLPQYETNPSGFGDSGVFSMTAPDRSSTTTLLHLASQPTQSNTIYFK